MSAPGDDGKGFWRTWSLKWDGEAFSKLRCQCKPQIDLPGPRHDHMLGFTIDIVSEKCNLK